VDELDELLREQADYYRAFARQYDGAYEMREDLRSLEVLADGLPVAGDVLELACGTGQWSRLLAARGHRVTAVDAAPEMLALARERVAGLDVEFVRADLFDWRPPRRFDTVFFCFWLSHVPPERFAGFWRMVGDALKPGGAACFVDSSLGDLANEEMLDDYVASSARRPLPDGGTARVVKVFHDPGVLTQALHGLGWSARVWPIGEALLAGAATPNDQ
jgi:demethylmenaquinone methyltransferase/2-methoxy-6-polyprenyl-1,4-benzoquinol methylase